MTEQQMVCRQCADGVPHLDLACGEGWASAAEAFARAGQTVVEFADRAVDALTCDSGQEPARTVAAIDAALDGLCPCGAEPAPGSPWCSDDCRPSHIGQDTDAPGSGPRTAARWRPDLVTASDDSGWTLLDRHHRNDTGLTYSVLTDFVRDMAFLRVDDGHRFVGLEMRWAELEESGPSEPFRRLEWELSDRRRLDPERATRDPTSPRLMGEATRPTVAERAATHAELAAAGTVFWVPTRPADPEAPTLAELENAVDLTPYVTGPQQAMAEAMQEGWYWCEACHRTGEPTPPRSPQPDDDPLAGQQAWTRGRDRCVHCRTPVPTDLVITQDRDDTGVELRVERGNWNVVHRIPESQLQTASDPQTAITRTLVQLQQQAAGAAHIANLQAGGHRNDPS